MPTVPFLIIYLGGSSLWSQVISGILKDSGSLQGVSEFSPAVFRDHHRLAAHLNTILSGCGAVMIVLGRPFDCTPSHISVIGDFVHHAASRAPKLRIGVAKEDQKISVPPALSVYPIWEPGNSSRFSSGENLR